MFVALTQGQSGTNGKNSRFSCIQEGFSLDEVVQYGSGGKSSITVGNKLAGIKARCRNGKLIDGRGREIRFYRAVCWGNPPADYVDILDRQRKELAALKKKYTVIEITCDPRAVARDRYRGTHGLAEIAKNQERPR